MTCHYCRLDLDRNRGASMAMRVLLVIVFALALGSSGHSVGQPPLQHWEFNVPRDEHKGRQKVGNGTKLACHATAKQFLSEQIGGPTSSVRITAGAGTDKADVRISEDGRLVSWLMASSVEGATTEAATYYVLENEGSWLVAAGQGFNSIDTVMIDLNSGNALWSSTGFKAGLTGQSIYFECD